MYIVEIKRQKGKWDFNEMLVLLSCLKIENVSLLLFWAWKVVSSNSKISTQKINSEIKKYSHILSQLEPKYTLS